MNTTAQQHDATALSLLQTVPGIGKVLSLVRLDDIHQIDRFPRVQDFVSYARPSEANGPTPTQHIVLQEDVRAVHERTECLQRLEQERQDHVDVPSVRR